MSYDLVFANGCSFVQGSEVNGEPLPSFPVENVPNRFSELIAKHFDCEEVNIASGGAGNNKVFRTTFEWLEMNLDRIKTKKVLFIFGLSHPGRNELYSAEAGRYIKFSPTANEVLIEDDLTNKMTSRKNIEEFNKVYWTNFYDYEQKVKEHYMLKKVLKQYISSLIPDADIFIFPALGEYPTWFTDKLPLEFPFPEVDKHSCWAVYCALNGFYDKGTTHPNKQAHKDLANFIIDKYDTYPNHSSVQD